jgi:DNA-binding GntR family transcriptional regulator
MVGSENVTVTTTPKFRFDDTVAKRVSAVDLVRSALRTAILRGDLAGGSSLVQTELAAQLGVSTTPVREAMRDLATEGLITLDSHKIGTVRQLDWDEMVEIVDMRRALENVAVERAMSNMTPELLAEAKSLADDLASENDVGAWVEKNNSFHSLFHDATDTSRLSTLLKSLEEAAGVFVAQAQRLHPETRRQAIQDHYALIEAYQNHDITRAVEVQHTHLNLPLVSVAKEADSPSDQ